MKIINILLLSSLLLITSLPSHAGKIYRFIDKNGVSTMSKSLPPYIAQLGYDILDDKSLQLIERVYTREELIKRQKAQQIIDLAEKEISDRREEDRKRIIEQRLRDQNLLDRYPTIAVFIKSRDADLNYRQGQIKDLEDQLIDNKKKLTSLQEKAAEEEMNGNEISINLNKSVASAKKEIHNNETYLNLSLDENKDLNQQYKTDLARLRLLLGLPEPEPDVKETLSQGI